MSGTPTLPRVNLRLGTQARRHQTLSKLHQEQEATNGWNYSLHPIPYYPGTSIDSRTARRPERKLLMLPARLDVECGNRPDGRAKERHESNLTSWHVPMITAVEPDLLLPSPSSCMCRHLRGWEAILMHAVARPAQQMPHDPKPAAESPSCL